MEFSLIKCRWSIYGDILSIPYILYVYIHISTSIDVTKKHKDGPRDQYSFYEYEVNM